MSSGSGLLPYFAAFCAVALVLTFFMRRSMKGARPFRSGFCTIVTGRKGHGKSMFSVHEMLRHLGRPVYCKKCTKKPEIRAEFGAFKPRFSRRWYHYGTVASNTSLKLPDRLARFWHHVTSWDDLALWTTDEKGDMAVIERLPHSTLAVVDEAHLWCPARAGEVLPDRQKLLLSQVRKLEMEMLFITQNVLNVAVGLRRQTDEVGVCQKGMFGRMCITFWDPEEVKRPGTQSLWKYRYRVTRKLASAYDTFELIMPSDESEPDFGAPRRKQKSGAGVPPTKEGVARPRVVRPVPVDPVITSVLDARILASIAGSTSPTIPAPDCVTGHNAESPSARNAEAFLIRDRGPDVFTQHN